MAGPPRILIAGASGIFGRLLVRELLDTTPAQLVLAGRDLRKTVAVCQDLGAADRLEPRALDLSNADALARAAEACFAVACTAGPFQDLPRALPRAAVQAGAHWLDIADDPSWVLPLLADRTLNAGAAGAGLAVMPGASTVPALSGVLVRWCCARLSGARRARLTLYIGNRNSKGTASIASALGAGFDNPRPVQLPFGRRTAYRFPSPDAVLLREELGLRTEFRVAFEWGLASHLMTTLSPLSRRLAPRERQYLASALSVISRPLSRLGSDSGCLQAEVWADRGPAVRAALLGAGQRLVILPCALALRALLTGELQQGGLVHPATWLAPDEWVRRLEARGVRFTASLGERTI